MKLINCKSKMLNFAINSSIIQHIFYWSFFLVFFGFLWGSYSSSRATEFIVEAITLPFKMAVMYITVYYLFPMYLFKRKPLQFGVFFIATLVGVSILQRYVDNYLIIEYLYADWQKQAIFNPVIIVGNLLKYNIYLFVPATIKIVYFLTTIQNEHYALEKEKLETELKLQLLEKEKLTTELKLLKGQIRPHFLFNCINTIYSLMLKKSNQAIPVLMRLSGLLRYLLYETNAKQVNLQSEIDCIKNYIEIEHLRFEDGIDLSFNIEGDLNNSTIAPLLILPLVENSFKHCSYQSGEPAWIKINIKVEEGYFDMKVENSIPQSPVNNTFNSNGVGLQNIKRRLALLYKETHNIRLEKTNDSFIAKLNLKLNNSNEN